ncbi:MAG: photosystem II manganese-stabilizing polypeptide [Sodalinema sp.]|uniref:photosystem II manganese-stabilizing polypeptide n=1 Tax=Sodalinema sp. TaxID=3080550 RepID=UPI00120A9D1C|nr:MAG: Photosystem II manganese-stabilizing polypeptide [Phormidium sp. SL48-SHIP]
MRYRALVALLLAMCVGFLTACSEEPISLLSDETYTYDQIRNTGLANSCPQLPETARGSFDLDSETDYILTDLCLEPTGYFVKEESTNKREEAKFIGAKALTRYTSSLDQVTGDLSLDSNGVLTFEEQSGIDFQAITVQLPGGEQVPMLFTIKKLVATTPEGQTGISTSTDLTGDYIVPSYRGASFLDPKGRGQATGYDNAVALPAAADDEEIMRENVKETPVLDGNMSLQVSKVNSETGEIAGIFEAIQASDTDLGSKAPVDVKIRGLFYGRVEPKA